MLPDRAPLHFGVDLRADRYGDRWTAVLSFLGAGVVTSAVFAGAAALARRISLRLVDVPHATYWKDPRHEPELRRRLRGDVHHGGAATMLFLAGVVALQVHAAVTGRGHLPWLSAALLAGYLAGWMVWLRSRRYRPPDDGPAG